MRKQYVVMVLDRSSSMESIREEARAAFNRQVEAVRGFKDLDVRVGLVTFSTGVDVPVWDRHPDALAILTPEQYQPNGWTALYDGVGTAIERLEAQHDIGAPDTSVLVITITDGEENYSKRWSAADVQRNVKRLTDTKRWTFTYEGANHDVYKAAQKLGFNPTNAMVFQASASGMAKSAGIRSASTRSYMETVIDGVVCQDNFYAPAAEVKSNSNENG